MRQQTSADAAIEAGEAPCFAPAASSDAAFAGVRVKMVTSCPPLRRWPATGTAVRRRRCVGAP